MTDFYVGEQIVLKGTGRYWSGVNYSATVVDVNETTVKVRYLDGGYKRFKKEEFSPLVVSRDSLGNEDLYKFSVYEMDDDHYDPTVEAINKVEPLIKDLKEAITSEDYLKAHEIKQQISERMSQAEKLKDLQHSLKSSIQKQDFLKAHEIKQQI